MECSCILRAARLPRGTMSDRYSVVGNNVLVITYLPLNLPRQTGTTQERCDDMLQDRQIVPGQASKPTDGATMPR